MQITNTRIVAMLLLLAATGSSQAGETRWIASWASSPLGGKIVIPGVPADRIPPSPVVHGTLRYRLPLSQGGAQLVLRLTNEANSQALAIGAVTVGIAEAGLSMRGGTMRKVTFNGHSSIAIPGGAPAVSDPVDLTTSPSDAVIVSIFLPNDTQFPLGQRGLQASVLDNGDATQALSLEGARPTTTRTPVSAVLVASSSRAETIVAFGDSITDGGITDTPDVRGWPGHLAKRLMQASGHAPLSVANEGIGGNGLVTDIIGLNGLARFDRDVLSLPNVTYVVLLEGINDIGFSNPPGGQSAGPPVSTQEMIGAYRQLIERAHEHRIRLIAGTLLPYKGAMYYSENGEQVRDSLNEWIRTSRELDGVVDFDRALRDPTDSKKLNAAYDSGDHLHPSDAGYKAMAQAFELKQLWKSK
jgi:lysophospholipase L1-like esterase